MSDSGNRPLLFSKKKFLVFGQFTYCYKGFSDVRIQPVAIKRIWNARLSHRRHGGRSLDLHKGTGHRFGATWHACHAGESRRDPDTKPNGMAVRPGHGGYYPTAFRLEWMHDAEDNIRASSEYLLRIIRETKPDLLHLSQFAYGALNVDVPKVVVAHSDVVSWWVAVHGREPESSTWIDFYRDTVSRGLAGADAMVVPSRWMGSALVEHYGTRPFA